jgi:hypothetical protein
MLYKGIQDVIEASISRCSSVVEQCFRKAWAVSSILTTGSHSSNDTTSSQPCVSSMAFCVAIYTEYVTLLDLVCYLLTTGCPQYNPILLAQLVTEKSYV